MMRWLFLALMSVSYAMTLGAYFLVFKRFRSFEAFARDAVIFCVVLAFGQIQLVCLLFENELFPFYESESFLPEKFWLFWAGALGSYAPWIGAWAFFDNRRPPIWGNVIMWLVLLTSIAIGLVFGTFGSDPPNLMGLSILGGWKIAAFLVVLWHAMSTKFFTRILMLQFLLPMGAWVVFSSLADVLQKSGGWSLAEIFAAFFVHLFVSARLGYEFVKTAKKRTYRHAYAPPGESDCESESFWFATPLIESRPASTTIFQDEESTTPVSEPKEEETIVDSASEHTPLMKARHKTCISSSDIPYLSDSDVQLFDPNLYVSLPKDIPEATKLVLKTAGIKKKIAESNRELTFDALLAFKNKTKIAKEQNNDVELLQAVAELRQTFVKAGLDVVTEHNRSVRILDFMPPPEKPEVIIYAELPTNILINDDVGSEGEDETNRKEEEEEEIHVDDEEQTLSDKEVIPSFKPLKREPHFTTMNLTKRESAPLTVKSVTRSPFTARLSVERLLQLRVTFPLEFVHSGGMFLAPRDSTPAQLKKYIADDIRRNGLTKSSKMPDVGVCDFYLAEIGKLPEDQTFEYIPGIALSQVCDIELRSPVHASKNAQTISIEFPANWKLPARDFLVKNTDTASDVIILLSEEVQRQATWDTYSLFLDREPLDPSVCVLSHMKKAGATSVKLSKTNPKRASKSVKILSKDLLPRHIDERRKASSLGNIMTMLESDEGVKKCFVKIAVSSEIPHKGAWEGPIAPITFMLQNDWRPRDVAAELKKKLTRKRVLLNYKGFRSRLFLTDGTELKNRTQLKAELAKIEKGALHLEFKPTRSGSADEFSVSSESVEDDDDEENEPERVRLVRIKFSKSLRAEHGLTIAQCTLKISEKIEFHDVLRKLTLRLREKDQPVFDTDWVALHLLNSEIAIDSRRQLATALFLNPDPVEFELKKKRVDKKMKKRVIKIQLSKAIFPDERRYEIFLPENAGKADIVKLIQQKLSEREAERIKTSTVLLRSGTDGPEIRNKVQLEMLLSVKDVVPVLFLDRKDKKVIS